MNQHTFFAGTKLKVYEVFMLARLWLSEISVTSAVDLTSHSPNTVVAMWRHFRNLVISMLEEEDVMIGGPNIIVELDEKKLGKRKFNRGHRVEGVWLLVGVERSEERKVFVVPVAKRDTNTLRSMILRHVRWGSIVYTDMWRGYLWMDNITNYEHHTVNHSVEFKNHETGVHTNTVEGTNSGIKRVIQVRSRLREGMEKHLGEFVWRKSTQTWIHGLLL
jgi:transposase-like protein